MVQSPFEETDLLSRGHMMKPTNTNTNTNVSEINIVFEINTAVFAGGLSA
jgi:hypothetical protein